MATHDEMQRYAKQKPSKHGVCQLPWIPDEELLVSDVPASVGAAQALLQQPAECASAFEV